MIKKKNKTMLREYKNFHLAFISSISLKDVLNLPLNLSKDRFWVVTTIDGDSAGEWFERFAQRNLLKLNIHCKRLVDVCLIYPESLDTFLKEDYFFGGDEIYIASKEPSDDQLKRIEGGSCGDFSMGIAESVIEAMELIDADVYFSDCHTGLSIACKDRQFIENIFQELGKSWDIKVEKP